MFTLFAILPLLFPQADKPSELGKFILHKFEQPIGEETYTIKGDGKSFDLTDKFRFTDRGTPVPLSCTMRFAADLTPQSATFKGSTSRQSSVDAEMELADGKVRITEGKTTRTVAMRKPYVMLDGYSPVAAQMMAIRYCLRHRTESVMALPTETTVDFKRRGSDTLRVGGKDVSLDRYEVRGVIWGRETLWLDRDQNVAALVGCDAEFDHFEAILEPYESSLQFFVTRAAEDAMKNLAVDSRPLGKPLARVTAFVGARLIDGTGTTPVEDSVVVVKDARILAAGARSQVAIPKGARVIDVRGQSILPGLWDMHAHYEQVEWGPIYLAAGVTTVRDCGNEFEYITAVRKAIDEGSIGPRLLLAGLVDGSGPMSLGVARADNAEQARTVVQRYKNAGFNQIKIYSSVKPDVVKEICLEAHRLGLTVTGHVPNGMTAIECVEDGMDMINHIPYIVKVMHPKGTRVVGFRAPADLNSQEAKDALALFAKHQTVIDPTVALFELDAHSTKVPASSFEPGLAKLPKELAGALESSVEGLPDAMAALAVKSFDNMLSVIGALHKAGVPVVAGTDQAVPGHSLHRELELYVKAGFTPMEAIQAATIVPARAMGVDRDSGTIEVGKRADLILVDGDPTADIHNIRKVRRVSVGGRIYDCAPLWKSVGFLP